MQNRRRWLHSKTFWRHFWLHTMRHVSTQMKNSVNVLPWDIRYRYRTYKSLNFLVLKLGFFQTWIVFNTILMHTLELYSMKSGPDWVHNKFNGFEDCDITMFQAFMSSAAVKYHMIIWLFYGGFNTYKSIIQEVISTVVSSIFEYDKLIHQIVNNIWTLMVIDH